jgi:hypothetical protein
MTCWGRKGAARESGRGGGVAEGADQGRVAVASDGTRWGAAR